MGDIDTVAEKRSLELSFDPATIQHLGPKLYSRLPDAVAELVANSYDADAKCVLVKVEDTASGQIIDVTDDGHGMTPDEFDEHYLRIGRDRRAELGRLSRSGEREVSGKKGLGKLALFGIGHTVDVWSSGEGSPTNTHIRLVWDDILGSKGGSYVPKTEFTEAGRETGTLVRISNLQRATDVNAASLARSLARLVLYKDDGFELWVEGPDGDRVHVTSDLRRESIAADLEIRIPDDLPGERFSFLRENDVHGWITVSSATLNSAERGITLYAKKRRASKPEFFDAPATNFAYAYIVGEVEVDFIDDLDADVIATARNALNWEHPETAALRDELTELVKFAADERRRIKSEAAKANTRRLLGKDGAAWIDSIRSTAERNALAEVLEVIESPDTEYSSDSQSKIVGALRIAIPEYPELHWRHLDEDIKTEAISKAYREGRYDDALVEAVKRLQTKIKERLPEFKDLDGTKLFEHAFNVGSTPRLELVDLDGEHAAYMWSEETRKNIQVGIQRLACGVYSLMRTPLSHESRDGLFGAAVLTYEDCLDALSVVSQVARMVRASRRVD